MFTVILFVFAFVLATFAAVWASLPEPGRGRLIAAALAFFFAALLFGKEALGKYLPVVLVSLAMLSTGCDTMSSGFSDPKSATSILATQAFSLGLSKITGRSVSAADVDGAAALIRTLAGKKNEVTGAKEVPTATDIKTAAQSGTDSPKKASGFASQISSLISWAISKNVPPDKAIEIAASNLNQSAAVSKAP